MVISSNSRINGTRRRAATDNKRRSRSYCSFAIVICSSSLSRPVQSRSYLEMAEKMDCGRMQQINPPCKGFKGVCPPGSKISQRYTETCRSISRSAKDPSQGTSISGEYDEFSLPTRRPTSPYIPSNDHFSNTNAQMMRHWWTSSKVDSLMAPWLLYPRVAPNNQLMTDDVNFCPNLVSLTISTPAIAPVSKACAPGFGFMCQPPIERYPGGLFSSTRTQSAAYLYGYGLGETISPKGKPELLNVHQSADQSKSHSLGKLWKPLEPDSQASGKDGRRPRFMKMKYCAFCKKNNERPEFYKGHILRSYNEATKTYELICPVLRNYKCPKCGATGDDAHTLTYCPELIQEMGFRPVSIITKLEQGHDSAGRKKPGAKKSF